MNEGLLREMFRDCDDIRFRTFKAGEKKALVVYLYGLADATFLEKNVFETLMVVGCKTIRNANSGVAGESLDYFG